MRLDFATLIASSIVVAIGITTIGVRATLVPTAPVVVLNGAMKNVLDGTASATGLVEVLVAAFSRCNRP
jgi:hypothetical protein